jgi:hypothetical protein
MGEGVGTGIFYGSCLALLTEDFQMLFVSTKFLPWLLIQKQKETHFWLKCAC